MTRYNPAMRSILVGLLLCGAACAASTAPKGHGEDEAVWIDATILGPADLRQGLGSDPGTEFVVIEVRIAPKHTPYSVHPDDFILRSESSGEHSGPLLPGQVAGGSEMMVKRTYEGRSSAAMPDVVGGVRTEMRDGAGDKSLLAAVKGKILVDQESDGPVTGWLFFPFDKAKPKSLALSVTTPAGKIRIQFK